MIDQRIFWEFVILYVWWEIWHFLRFQRFSLWFLRFVRVSEIFKDILEFWRYFKSFYKMYKNFAMICPHSIKQFPIGIMLKILYNDFKISFCEHYFIDRNCSYCMYSTLMKNGLRKFMLYFFHFLTLFCSKFLWKEEIAKY